MLEQFDDGCGLDRVSKGTAVGVQTFDRLSQPLAPGRKALFARLLGLERVEELVDVFQKAGVGRARGKIEVADDLF